MIEIAVIDDELIWQERIGRQLEQMFQEDLTIHMFSSGREFVEENRRYDVVFFDVELENGDMGDGLELCRQYKERYPEQAYVAIILTTHTEFIRRGYISNAFRYINKGNLQEELQEAVVSIELNRRDRKCVEVHLKKLGKIQVWVNTIVCVETEGRKLVMRMQNGEKCYLDETLTAMVELLTVYGFYMIRKGVLVNMKYIVEVKEDYVMLKYIIPEKRYYISRRKYSDFLRVFTEWRMQRASG